MSKDEYWYNNNARVVIIPDESCIDVDTEEDLKKLKSKLANLKRD
jgi:choline kinase